MSKCFVAIAGNIGAGKSTLTRLLSERLRWQPFYEAVSENPYLADFYQDMGRFAFHSQVFFLSRRIRHHRSLVDFPGSVLQDRCAYEDAEIFAEALHSQGHIDQRDYLTYRELYAAMLDFIPPPDLILYLRCSVPTLVKRIALRGRTFEQGMDPSYLALLNDLYETWVQRFAQCRILTIEADRLDFVRVPEHVDQVVAEMIGCLPAFEHQPPAEGSETLGNS